MVLITGGTLDSTTPYEIIPGDVFNGQSAATGACFHPCWVPGRLLLVVREKNELTWALFRRRPSPRPRPPCLSHPALHYAMPPKQPPSSSSISPTPPLDGCGYSSAPVHHDEVAYVHHVSHQGSAVLKKHATQQLGKRGGRSPTIRRPELGRPLPTGLRASYCSGA